MSYFLTNPLSDHYLELKSQFYGSNLSGVPWKVAPATDPRDEIARSPYQPIVANPLRDGLGFKDYIEGDTFLTVTHDAISRNSTSGLPGTHETKMAPLLQKVIEDILHHNEIKLNTIYRACINLVIPQSNKKVNPHVDHFFDHKVLLIHLVSDIESGNTVICKDRFEKNKRVPDYTPAIEIPPIEDTVVHFDGLNYHYTNHGAKSRITMVATYD